MNDNAHDEGLTHTGDRYAISDRDLDKLAEAELAWERWDRTARWWATGDLDAIESWNAA
ncbi:MAG: hypothetical protein U0326_18995 [Polyangiales bacterium]